MLQKLGCRIKGPTGFHEVAMGQDQTGRALDLLQSCAAAGHWLYLDNVHLVATWLPALEAALHGLKPERGFILWLSSEPSASLPAGLLESCLVRY
jgi:Dynein heavy chain region D6 P-loop domain